MTDVKEVDGCYEGEEEPIDSWMMEWDLDMQVRERIACPERYYPASEARFATIEEWEKHYGKDWNDYLSDLV